MIEMDKDEFKICSQEEWSIHSYLSFELPAPAARLNLKPVNSNTNIEIEPTQICQTVDKRELFTPQNIKNRQLVEWPMSV